MSHLTLCLDLGNTQIFGGVFAGKQLLLKFRHASTTATSSDQYGVFLRAVLRENQIDHRDIKEIAICSVVPHLDYSLQSACIKYFGHDPFLLQAGVKTGLKIKYRNPLEVGADRIANAVAAINLFPQRNIIIVDFGTATTFCAISKDKDYLGGIIMPGMRLSMEALQNNTAKLSSVNIIRANTLVGRSAIEGIQSGLFYGQRAALKTISADITASHFADSEPVIIGTGGFAQLFQDDNIFDTIQPNLVLVGLQLTLAMNQVASTEN